MLGPGSGRSTMAPPRGRFRCPAVLPPAPAQWPLRPPDRARVRQRRQGGRVLHRPLGPVVHGRRTCRGRPQARLVEVVW